jgi:hypothetical protein
VRPLLASFFVERLLSRSGSFPMIGDCTSERKAKACYKVRPSP